LPPNTVVALIAALTALPFILVYWIWRYVARRRQAALFRTPRPWQVPTLERWAAEGWLDPSKLPALPPELVPAMVFYEWAWADPEVTVHWRFREAILLETPIEVLIADAWTNLPEANRAASRERLGAALQTATEWWGGAERGWNGRPLAMLGENIGKKQTGLPLLPMEDLTAAPSPGPIRPEMAGDADGPDLILALAAARRSQGLFVHPLAPKLDGTGSMIQGLSTQVASDVGRRVGAGIGSVLGPIGAMIGQHLGGMVGQLGGKAVASQMLPEPVQNALKETETTLASLGELAMSDTFAKAVKAPADAVLEQGQRLEIARSDRSRRFRERVWPTIGLALIEESLRFALAELQGYRAAATHFTAVARKAPDAVAGGMILQNPWLAARIGKGPERMTAVRQCLNRAAGVIRRARPSA
jgi:hypothetical protein